MSARSSAAATPLPVERQPVSEFSVIALLTDLLRYSPLIIGATVVMFVIGGVRAANVPRTYTATVAFLPELRADAMPVSPLGGRYSGDPTQTPAFYAELVRSDAVLREVAESSVAPATGRPRTLIEIYGGGADQLAARRRTISLLRGRITPSERMGVITVNVTWTDPVMAEQVAGLVLKGIESFNEKRRLAKTSREREFTEERTQEAAVSLRAAEERHRAFLQANREWQSSPALRIEQQRLERAVDMMQELYIARAQAFEQAKVDEVRDAPAFTLLSPPERPTGANPRRTLPKAAFAGVLGAMGIAVLIVLISLWRRIVSESSRETAELTRVARSVSDALRHPLRWVNARRAATS